MSNKKTLHIAFPNSHCEMHIAKGALADLGTHCAQITSGLHALILSDEKVGPVYGSLVKKRLEEQGFSVFEKWLPLDENFGDISVVANIWQILAQAGFKREDLLVAVGSSSILKTAGFIASAYNYGMNFVEVPTTLFAMADTCIYAKNSLKSQNKSELIGTIYQPRYVCSDLRCLKTMSEKGWEDGVASILQCAIVAPRRSFYEWLRHNSSALLEHDFYVLQDVIYFCAEYKANAVMKDPTDSQGIQASFDYGLEFARALYAVAPKNLLSWGFACIEGMRFSSRLAVEVLGTSSDFVTRQEELFTRFGFDELLWSTQPESLFQALCHMQASNNDIFSFVLPHSFSECEVVEVSQELVFEHLSAWCIYKKKLIAQN